MGERDGRDESGAEKGVLRVWLGICSTLLSFWAIPLYIISSVDVRARHMYVIYIPTAGSELNGLDPERQQSCFRESSEGAEESNEEAGASIMKNLMKEQGGRKLIN